ncbi:hypothetical protein [Amycolatopsis sp. w19]|uniref:hypothetical protein n=1 Tax=Amycolatopsis sp. w19 TaxID=3448134 RepID=UPI003F1BABBA
MTSTACTWSFCRRRCPPGSAPSSFGKIRHIHDLLTKTFEGGRVEDFVIDGSFPGTDADDEHVHAAAIACSAEIILSCDNGFSLTGQDPDSLPYEVYTPDEFFVLVDDSSPQLVREVTGQ